MYSAPAPTAASSGSGDGSLSNVSSVSVVPAPADQQEEKRKLRSCVMCRQRKVRCDKMSPCSNCRRGNIACVPPSNDRPPRWARRLARANQDALSGDSTAIAAMPHIDKDSEQHAMQMLQHLEGLVKDLNNQLDQAHAAIAAAIATATAADSPTGGGGAIVQSPQSSVHGGDGDQRNGTPASSRISDVTKQSGQSTMPSKNRYISRGFWSHVTEELDRLKEDAQVLATDDDSASEEESTVQLPSMASISGIPSARYSLLFSHNMVDSTTDLRELGPLPSQIPFLLSVFSENVNFFAQILHMPTIKDMAKSLRKPATSNLTPSNEALMFSIYYASITSLEEEDVMSSFGATKTELGLKYRLGLEQALAKADFLAVSDMVLLQAFTIFLLLVCRHESPSWVWNMTGLAIRMGHALGLHRDGTHFPNLTPFEVEMRRRLWWMLCALDIRASEDQTTDLCIPIGSFDTRYPLRINDVDINSHTRETPPERQGLTDMSLPVAWYVLCNTIRQLMATGASESPMSIQAQSSMLEETYEKLELEYFQYSTEFENMAHRAAILVFRQMKAKTTLLINLPTLFSTSGELDVGRGLAVDIRDKMFVTAIEVAEYYHAVNTEPACRPWRWMFQTYTHWHTTIYLLIEIIRRSWSPIVERAWITLHSSWLIPAQYKSDKNLQIWIPLRRLIAKARRHRDTEIKRLSGDAAAVDELEQGDRNKPAPASSGILQAQNDGDSFLQHWRSLFGLSGTTNMNSSKSQPMATDGANKSHHEQLAAWLHPNFQSMHLSDTSVAPAGSLPSMAMGFEGGLIPERNAEASYDGFASAPLGWPATQPMDTGAATTWLWIDPAADGFADVDGIMDTDENIDWYEWLKSAQDMEYNKKSQRTVAN
ncbi:fungal-specific transcription factor domain-containing protein [Xylariales sp. PMI_506]|nr:fungal-specific transcription factor domain-containing protein [Xylariales sp. PMI_506]